MGGSRCGRSRRDSTEQLKGKSKKARRAADEEEVTHWPIGVIADAGDDLPAGRGPFLDFQFDWPE